MLAQRLRQSKQFAAGLAVGLVLGMTVSAWAAQVVGRNGYLLGWEVTLEGDTVCTDPYVWVSLREIECD